MRILLKMNKTRASLSWKTHWNISLQGIEYPLWSASSILFSLASWANWDTFSRSQPEGGLVCYKHTNNIQDLCFNYYRKTQWNDCKVQEILTDWEASGTDIFLEASEAAVDAAVLFLITASLLIIPNDDPEDESASIAFMTSGRVCLLCPVVVDVDVRRKSSSVSRQERNKYMKTSMINIAKDKLRALLFLVHTQPN